VLLQEQRKVAAAGLASAQAGGRTAGNALEIAKSQYQQALEGALVAGKASRLEDWFSKQQQQFEQPNWYFARSEQVQAVQAQVDAAKSAWEAAERAGDSGAVGGGGGFSGGGAAGAGGAGGVPGEQGRG
jgi:uncharacterized membrane protein